MCAYASLERLLPAIPCRRPPLLEIDNVGIAVLRLGDEEGEGDADDGDAAEEPEDILGADLGGCVGVLVGVCGRGSGESEARREGGRGREGRQKGEKMEVGGREGEAR